MRIRSRRRISRIIGTDALALLDSALWNSPRLGPRSVLLMAPELYELPKRHRLFNSNDGSRNTVQFCFGTGSGHVSCTGLGVGPRCF